MFALTRRRAALSLVVTAALLSTSLARAQNAPVVPVDETRSTATAYARPIKLVEFDGKLADWPRDMPWYPLLTEYGVYGPTDVASRDLSDNDDMTARFTVGYNAEANMLLVAIVVRDDVHVVGNSYNNTDAVEVYVDGTPPPDAGPMVARSMAVVQYTMVAGNGTYVTGGGKVTTYPDANKANLAKYGYNRDEVTRETTYEVGLPVFGGAQPGNAPQRTAIAGGQRYRFDVAVADFDNDSLATALVFWGPIGAMKYAESQLLGDVVLLTAEQTLHTIKGQALQPDGAPLAKQQLAFKSNGMSAGEVLTDDAGRFTFALPAGDYELTTARIASAKVAEPLKFTVGEDGAKDELKLEATAVIIPEVLRKAIDRYRNAKFYSDDTRVIFSSSPPGGGTIETRYAFDMQFKAPGTLKIVTNNNIVVSADNKELSINIAGQPAAEPVKLDGRITVLDIAHAWGGFPDPKQPVAFQGSYRTNGELPVGGSIGGLFVHKLLFDPDKALNRAQSIERIGAATLNRKPMTMVQIVQPAVDVFPGLPFSGYRRGVSTSLMLWIDDDGAIHQSRFRFDMNEVFPPIAVGSRNMPVFLLTAQHTNIAFEEAGEPME